MVLTRPRLPLAHRNGVQLNRLWLSAFLADMSTLRLTAALTPALGEWEMSLSSSPEGVLARKCTLCGIDEIGPALLAVWYWLIGQ